MFNVVFGVISFWIIVISCFSLSKKRSFANFIFAFVVILLCKADITDDLSNGAFSKLKTPFISCSVVIG